MKKAGDVIHGGAICCGMGEKSYGREICPIDTTSGVLIKVSNKQQETFSRNLRGWDFYENVEERMNESSDSEEEKGSGSNMS